MKFHQPLIFPKVMSTPETQEWFSLRDCVPVLVRVGVRLLKKQPGIKPGWCFCFVASGCPHLY